MVKIKLITNFTSFQKVKDLLLHNQNQSGSLKIQDFYRCSVLPLKSALTPHPLNPYKSSSSLFLKPIGTPLFLATIPFCFSHGSPTNSAIFSEEKDQHSKDIQISSQLSLSGQFWLPVLPKQKPAARSIPTGQASETTKEAPWQKRRHCRDYNS